MLTLSVREVIPAIVLVVLGTRIFARFFISILAIDGDWQRSGVGNEKFVEHPSSPPRDSAALHGNRLVTIRGLSCAEMKAAVSLGSCPSRQSMLWDDCLATSQVRSSDESGLGF